MDSDQSGGIPLTITGALADGTAFNQTPPICLATYLPIYANLYNGKGLLFGWVNLDLANTTAVPVGLTWIHPTRKSGLYPQGFTNVVGNQIAVSAWGFSGVPPLPPPLQNTILSMTNLSILDNIYDTNTPIAVSTSTPDKILGASVNGTINPKTGGLTVTIGSGPGKVIGHGAILFNTTNGGGYFLTKTNAQGFTLTP